MDARLKKMEAQIDARLGGQSKGKGKAAHKRGAKSRDLSAARAAAPPSADRALVPNDDLEVEVGVEERKEDYWIETPYEHISVHSETI